MFKRSVLFPPSGLGVLCLALFFYQVAEDKVKRNAKESKHRSVVVNLDY